MILKPEPCKHEADPATLVYDGKYGRRGRCKHCGAAVFVYRTANIKHSAPGEGKPRMSKKDRRRAKAAKAGKAEKEGRA